MTDSEQAIFVKHWKLAVPTLYKRIYRLKFSHEDAGEIVQDVGIKMFTAGTIGDSPEHFEFLALGCVKWACASRWRLSSRRRDVKFLSLDDVDAEGPEFHSHDAPPDSNLALKRAVENLPPKQREIVNLLALGLDDDEISRRLGISSSSVRSISRHARLKLIDDLI